MYVSAQETARFEPQHPGYLINQDRRLQENTATSARRQAEQR